MNIQFPIPSHLRLYEKFLFMFNLKVSRLGANLISNVKELHKWELLNIIAISTQLLC